MPTKALTPAASVIFVSDGEVRARPTDLFPDTSPSGWDEHPDLLDASGRLVFAVGAHLVITPHCTALVDLGLGELNSDTATGATYRSGRLLANLAAVGVTPTDVDLVVFTHLHRDHVGWTSAASTAGRKIIFDRARHVVRRAEWDHWQGHPSPLGPDRDAVLDPLADIIEFCEDGDRLVPGLEVIATPGHTPGHLSLLVDLGHGRRCVIAGDVLHSPAQLHHPEWRFGSDLAPDQAVETRRRLLTAYGPDVLACTHFTHQPAPGRDGPATARSATWQMSWPPGTGQDHDSATPRTLRSIAAATKRGTTEMTEQQTATRTVLANFTMSIDGYVTGPGGPTDMSWVVKHAVSDQARDILTRLVNGTTAVLGRVNAEGFRGYWVPVGQDENADPRDRAYGQWLEQVEKVIFSTTQTDTDWHNARMVNGDPAEVIRELRDQPGGDIVINNSLSLIRALLAADELDRLIVTLCPELSGGGVRMFEDGFPSTSWGLTDVVSTDSGALILQYDRARTAE